MEGFYLIILLTVKGVSKLEEIIIQRLRTKSLFKIIFLGLFASIIPLSVLLGILGYFDLATLHWNGESVSGPKALIVGPMIGLLFVGIFGFFTTLFTAVGLYFYSKKINLKLYYYSANEANHS